MTERDDFGPRLRRERERRNITLREIADKTKIGVSFFAAMERNDFSRWPSGIFRRSFLRAYAETIGLDSERLVQEFVRLFPGEGDHPAGPVPSAPPSPMAEAPRAAEREVRERRPGPRVVDARTREQRAAPNGAREGLAPTRPPATRTSGRGATARAVVTVVGVAATAAVAVATGLVLGWTAAWPAAALVATLLFVVGSVLRPRADDRAATDVAEKAAHEHASAAASELRPVAKRRANVEQHATARRHQVRRVERPRLM